MKLPDKWMSAKLGDIVSYGETDKAEPSEIEGDAWVLELEDIEKDTSKILQRQSFDDRKSKSTKNRFQAGDILYGKLRPYLNKVVIADRAGYCTTEIVPIRPHDHMDGRYLFYWLKTHVFLDYVNAVSHGLNMPRLGTDAGRSAPFVLAPLNEQKRIADKLDQTLAIVERAKARLARVPEILKQFRQSVLAAATDGRLTEDWRVNNSHGEQWSHQELGKISEKITDGEHQTPRRCSNGRYLLSARNIQNGKIVLDDVDYVDDSEFERIRKRCGPAIGDVLLSCSGSVGRAALVDKNNAYVMVRSAALIRPMLHLITPTFLMYCIQSPNLQEQIKEKSSATAQANIFIGSIKSLRLAVPTLAEQLEIVRRVETLFALADRIEARYQAISAQVDKLTQSLLAKAFRGELVPQDPNDEPASVLLDRIRAQRASELQAKRGRRKGTHQPA